jgi:hypothetical protein
VLSLKKIPLNNPLLRSRIKMILDWINRCLSKREITNLEKWINVKGTLKIVLDHDKP